MNIADALSGRAKLAGVQWVLSATPRRVLRDQLRTLLSAGTMLGPCHLRHVRFRPGQRLTAYYDVHVQIGAIEAYHARPIAVTWGSGSDPDQSRETVDLAKMQTEAVCHGVAEPFRQLMADFPESSMHVRVSPLDARFIQLVRVSDPRHVCAMLADANPADSAASDQRRISEYTVTPIKYRPGKRHVLRYDPVDPVAGTVFAKLYTGEDGARAFRVARYVADWLAEHGEGVNSVRPLAYMAEDAVVLYPQVFGAPLSDHLRCPSGGVARCLERAGAALYALHHLPEAVAGPLELHDFAAEIRETARASDYISALLPQVGAAIDALLDRARELHERLPQEPPTFTHGDFKSEHIWVAAGGLTLIDFDTSRLADPALDVGKFLADLQLRHAANSHPGLEEAHESFLVGYTHSAPNERLIRARLYEAVELVKMAARRGLFKHDWASRTARLVGRAQAVINDVQLTLGLPAPAVSTQVAQHLSKALHAHCGGQLSSVSVHRVGREGEIFDLSGNCHEAQSMSLQGRRKSSMNVADALSERATLRGIQWLLLSATSRKVLRDQLRALLSAGAILGPCHLRKVRFRPGRELSAYYDARVRIEATEGYRARPIAVTWRSGTDGNRHEEMVDLAKMQAEAVRHGVAAPFRQLMADFPESSIHVRVSPLDARFIQLVRVSDPRHVCAMLADANPADSAASDQRRMCEYTVTPVHYRPGKRHVLRYDPVDPAKGGTVFAKLYIGEDGARAFRVATKAADWLAEHGEGVNCVRPLAYMAEDGVVLYPRVPGAPLSDHTQRPYGLARWLRRAGAALRTLHHLPVALAGPLEPRDFGTEIRSIARASDHIPVLLPRVGSAIEALLDRARELHERLPQESPTFTHGDLKSKHIWVAAGGLTLIDFDNSHLADPALDVGKFLADWQFWHAACDQPGLDEAYESFLAGYAPATPKERLIRARLYEAVELVKWTVLRVHPFEHDWASRTARLVGRAQAVIDDLQLTLGLPARQRSVHGAVNIFQSPPHAPCACHHPSARGGGR